MKTIAFLCLLLLCACDSGTEISSANYDQSCKAEIDCTPVYQGDVCDLCGCANTAVNQSQVNRYQMDIASIRLKCAADAGSVVCSPCSPRRALCTGSKCSSRQE